MALVEPIGAEDEKVANSAGGTSSAKRAMDVIIGVPLCLLAVPVVVALAVLMALQLRANPFFVHDRLGHSGRSLRIPKLRTLPVSTPTYADKTVTRLQPPTRLAELLRRTHLDELPQLLLVPFGRLSLVGPRPVMVAELPHFRDPADVTLRCSVPQGCTGLWQISVDQKDRVADHPKYAAFYIAQHTVRLDLWILWRTGLQFMGARPIELSDVPRWALRSPELVPALVAS